MFPDSSFPPGQPSNPQFSQPDRNFEIKDFWKIIARVLNARRVKTPYDIVTFPLQPSFVTQITKYHDVGEKQPDEKKKKKRN